jgi:hypothetical protein
MARHDKHAERMIYLKINMTTANLKPLSIGRGSLSIGAVEKEGCF